MAIVFETEFSTFYSYGFIPMFKFTEDEWLSKIGVFVARVLINAGLKQEILDQQGRNRNRFDKN